jgi:hypothetical protein
MRLYLEENNKIFGYIEFKKESYDKVYLIYKYLAYKHSQYEKLFNTSNNKSHSEILFQLMAKMTSHNYFLQTLNNNNVQFIFIPLKLDEILKF